MSDEELKRLFEGLREDNAAAHAETRRQSQEVRQENAAAIKFSHAELDRRVRNLEQDVADLQSRVERLESSTH